MQWFLLAVAGSIGAILRYAVSGWVQRSAGGTFPWGTLAVNLTGCIAIGLLAPLLMERIVRPEYRVAILIGLLGSFTTFSTFGYETFRLLSDGQFGHAAAYVLAMNAGGLLAVWIGYRGMEHLL
jgi:fluoride exporter